MTGYVSNIQCTRREISIIIQKDVAENLAYLISANL